MNWKKIKIRSDIKAALMLLLSLSAIAFIEKQHNIKTCQEIDIYVHNTGNDFFLEKEDVYKLITADESDFIIGNSYDRIDLRAIESRISKNEYVDNSQAYVDLVGNLTVDVNLNKPIARILIPGKKDKYLCSNNKIVSTSENFTSRVLLVGGAYFDGDSPAYLQSDTSLTQLFQLMHFIYKNAFWKAQIAQMEIDRNGSIILYPQITKQKIEFGRAENIEDKFRRLKIFYKRILPEKGWNTYTRVNIEYENQIICE